ncbi:MAG: MltA-interacting MipA family protein [Hyphomicrobium sp.]|nr:MAG: MltA-interacting MipA family protein [Hyphomicrobium sp.]
MPYHMEGLMRFPHRTRCHVCLSPMEPWALAAILTVTIAGVTPALSGGLFGGGGSDVELQAGGVAIVKPKYEGSNEYEVVGAPIVGPAGGTGNGFVQFKGVDDLRFKLIDNWGFETGPLVGYRFERDQDDADRLRGLGDVDGGLVVGGYAAYNFGSIKPFVSYHHQVTGDETGGVARLGVEAKVPVMPWLLVTAIGGATWADDDYMQSFFGITAAQSAASAAGLARFDAEAGVKDVFFGVSTDVPIAERWTLKLGGKYTHLLGDAADSPIVESESQWQGTLGLTYRFSVGR